MAIENNPSNEQDDIAHFLEKFQDPNLNTFDFQPSVSAQSQSSEPDLSDQNKRSFEKLEKKIQELEEKFDASERQSEAILSELAQTREHMKRQKSHEAFLERLSVSIANLRASVENLTRAQQDHSFAFREPDVQRGFDTSSHQASHTDIYQYGPDNYREAQARRKQQEQAEKERIISSLHQKASQLKAVNTALDREIKKVQQEKMEALKKSAEQAKEILSLRDQLNEAEERFKSFNFEGRIISIRQEYQQRVDSLETQLKEISDTCMKQVEEIEMLRTENIKLQHMAAEKEQALGLLEQKEHELQALKVQMLSLQESADQTQSQQDALSETIRSLETQRDELSVQFEAAQNELDSVRRDKELVERNFQELLSKINSNDAVIEQLKQKIDVLCKQNEELSQQNSHLAQEKGALSEGKKQLEKQLEAVQTAAAEEKKQLEEQLKAAQEGPAPEKPLATKVPAYAALSPREAKEELPLILSALETVRVAAEDPTTDLAEPNQPSLQPPAPITAAMDKKSPVQKSDTPAENPVEMTRQAKAKVQTEADLPEIKVAPPQPPADSSLVDGEDFLNKTDNFIGRIKWSIFHEDR
ncbi:MAG: hypothetical protein IKP96_02495 [Elusimicrobiaceae bacterium]|nr:hypothetical protein [Elusimicrobiaceae bacterium]